MTLQLEKLLNGRSCYWLARQTGLAHTTIARMKNANKISYHSLDKLCEALKCEPGDLLSRTTHLCHPSQDSLSNHIPE